MTNARTTARTTLEGDARDEPESEYGLDACGQTPAPTQQGGLAAARLLAVVTLLSRPGRRRAKLVLVALHA